jgi:hypothetical protein
MSAESYDRLRLVPTKPPAHAGGAMMPTDEELSTD